MCIVLCVGSSPESLGHSKDTVENVLLGDLDSQRKRTRRVYQNFSQCLNLEISRRISKRFAERCQPYLWNPWTPTIQNRTCINLIRRCNYLLAVVYSPQLRFIHLHQLFRIGCTWFESDAVTLRWRCANRCRVPNRSFPDAIRRSQPEPAVQ